MSNKGCKGTRVKEGKKEGRTGIHKLYLSLTSGLAKTAKQQRHNRISSFSPLAHPFFTFFPRIIEQ